jgi:hypothetical protein
MPDEASERLRAIHLRASSHEASANSVFAGLNPKTHAKMPAQQYAHAESTMRLRIFASLITLSAIAAGLWWLHSKGRLPFVPVGRADSNATAQAPAKPTYTIPPANFVPRNKAEQRFITSTDHAALLKEIDGLRDVDSLYLRALIIDACNAAHPSRAKETPEERLKKFRDTTVGPFREQRIALFEHQQRNGARVKCANFTQPLTDRDVDAAFDEAADAGSLHGGVDRIRRRLLIKALPDNTPIIGAPAAMAGVQFYEGTGPTPDEAALLIRALASREPALIREAGDILGARYTDYEIRLPDGKGIDGLPASFVWEAVACHYAGGCGPESWSVQINCILHSRCDVSSQNEALQRYTLSADQWTALVRNRDALIRIIDSGDFSQLNPVRGKPQNFWRNQLPMVTSPRFRPQP